MTPKFVPLDEAAELLGVSKDQLNALREQGNLRAYKDGASWKFRSEDIERMAEEGLPEIDSGSSLDLDFDLDGDSMNLGDLSLEESASSGKSALPANGEADDEFAIDSDDLAVGPEASSLELELVGTDEPSDTTETEGELAGESDDLELSLDDEEESILLSEPELGSSERPPSTIIGKADLDLDDEASDLNLTGSSPNVSDVRLADEVDIEELELASGSDAKASFEDLDELEIDLEAESSRVLAPEDLAAAQKAAQAQQQAPEASDLRLDDDIELATGSGAGLTGLSGLELEGSGTGASNINLGSDDDAKGSGLTGLSALEIEDEDDFVLGDGSDITLSSADSGINLSPSDSGLALDDPSLAGSAMGSSLDLGSQLGGDSFSLSGSDAPLGDEGFELSPVSESEAVEDEEDSSQVIALDAFEESQGADDLLGAGAGLTPAAVAGPATLGAATAAQPEVQFGVGVVSFLCTCVILLCLCGIMVFDIVRNMWSWGEPYTLNSTLIEGLTGLFFG